MAAVGGVGILAAAVALAPAARAEDGDGGQGRAVRLSAVTGDVQLSLNGEALADHALVNTPLFEGTQVTTGDDGRAEIQFEDGSVARIPPASSLTLSVLKGGGDTELLLNSGMGYFELQSSAVRVRFDSSVATGNGFTVLRIGLDQAPGEVAVFSGNAHMEGSSGSVDAHGGESVSLDGYSVSESIEPDSWDAWNSDRDRARTTEEAGSTPATNSLPNSNNPAWDDLNSNGTWYNVPDQGYVWSPYEASSSSWDPFGEGYWVWSPHYGYMWVSVYSWGYLPYQCGIWNWYGGFGWGWAPQNCRTWWGGGGGWGFNIGYAPTWYRLPHRPYLPRPRNPRPTTGGGGGRLVAARPVGPAPVISVNRKLQVGGSGGSVQPVSVLPPRGPSQPVQIGGVVARPLPVTTLRPGYRPQEPVSTRQTVVMPREGTRPVYAPPGTSRPGYSIEPQRPIYAPAPQRPVYEPAPQRPGYTPAPQPAPSRPGGVYTPPRPSSGGSGGSSYRPAPAPRPSSGGGGGSHPSGGGGHPSGGGGNSSGGGGSSHSSGGGSHK
ncbi:MAG TPA: DUF6600 domain-containing protein [Terracidiphilus sp.]|nr:DUF6600 domain-containing protein [Terracidiphilus sp.]